MKKIIGWTLYVVESADGYYATGMCRSIKKRIAEINIGGGGPFFGSRNYRRPAKLLYKEERLPFLEAHAKLKYIRKMSRPRKEKLMKTGVWPIGGSWKKFLMQRDSSY